MKGLYVQFMRICEFCYFQVFGSHVHALFSFGIFLLFLIETNKLNHYHKLSIMSVHPASLMKKREHLQI